MSTNKKLPKQAMAVCKADVSLHIKVLEKDYNNLAKADR